jgi:thioredoxin-related protein
MKAFLIMILLAFAPAPPSWLTDFTTAKETATQEHKYILLSFSGSDWCGPCIKMKKEVFESEAFLSLATSRLVLLRADFPRSKKNQLDAAQIKHNEALAEKYNPLGKFPFTVLLDAEGTPIKKWDGYVFASHDTFLVELRAALPQ